MYRAFKEALDTTMTSGIKIDYNFLGKTGLKVSNVCLGAMTFGTTSRGQFGEFFSNPKQLQENDAHKVMDRFVALGGNFIDTADIYSDGNSEKFIGTWLKKQNREDIIIATKCRFPMDLAKHNGLGLSRQHIMKSCDDSLKRLQTDYIDLYQAHSWDNATPIEETLRAFDDLIKCGKIRYYGFSNVSGWQLQKIVDTAKELHLNPCVSLQQQYNLLVRESEFEPFQVCQIEGIGVLPYSPLKGGLLTGRFQKDKEPDSKDSRVGYMHKKMQEGKVSGLSPWDDYAKDENFWKLAEILQKIAKKHRRSVPQVAIRWLLQRNVVSSVIIGCTSIQQLEDNMAASGGWELSGEEMNELMGACPLNAVYPYGMLGFAQMGRENKFNPQPAPIVVKL